jgi:hypothetical protein
MTLEHIVATVTLDQIVAKIILILLFSLIGIKDNGDIQGNNKYSNDFAACYSLGCPADVIACMALPLDELSNWLLK